eukprot:355353-Chlamydomonas_euryale.AAC.2
MCGSPKVFHLALQWSGALGDEARDVLLHGCAWTDSARVCEDCSCTGVRDIHRNMWMPYSAACTYIGGKRGCKGGRARMHIGGRLARDAVVKLLTLAQIWGSREQDQKRVACHGPLSGSHRSRVADAGLEVGALVAVEVEVDVGIEVGVGFDVELVCTRACLCLDAP